jgi:excisionase family DNA binding protein
MVVDIQIPMAGSNLVTQTIPKSEAAPCTEAVQDFIVEVLPIIRQLIHSERDRVPKNYLTRQEAADYLNISFSTFRRLEAKYEIPRYRVERRVLYRLEELDAWMKRFHEEGSALADAVLGGFDLFRTIGRSLRLGQNRGDVESADAISRTKEGKAACGR